MQLFQHSPQIVPSGDKTWLSGDDFFQYCASVLIAISHHCQARQQQRRIDVVWILSHQLLSELFRFSKLALHKQFGGFVQLGMRRRLRGSFPTERVSVRVHAKLLLRST